MNPIRNEGRDDQDWTDYVAALHRILRKRHDLLVLCETAWAREGFRGVEQIRIQATHETGESPLKLGILASGVSVLSVRTCTETHAVLVRYRSDNRKLVIPLAATLTDVCDAYWEQGGYHEVEKLYGADILLYGESRIIPCPTNHGPALIVCEVQGAHLVLTEYFANGTKRRYVA